MSRSGLKHPNPKRNTSEYNTTFFVWRLHRCTALASISHHRLWGERKGVRRGMEGESWSWRGLGGGMKGKGVCLLCLLCISPTLHVQTGGLFRVRPGLPLRSSGIARGKVVVYLC